MEKEAVILRGEAIKEQKKRVAIGEAEAIELVQKATAEALERLNAANPNEAVLQLKVLEAFEKAADGKATKIIIPSEIQGLAGLAARIKEMITADATQTEPADPPAQPQA